MPLKRTCTTYRQHMQHAYEAWAERVRAVATHALHRAAWADHCRNWHGHANTMAALVGPLAPVAPRLAVALVALWLAATPEESHYPHVQRSPP